MKTEIINRLLNLSWFISITCILACIANQYENEIAHSIIVFSLVYLSEKQIIK